MPKLVIAQPRLIDRLPASGGVWTLLDVTLRIPASLLLWKLQGRRKPSVFFGIDGRPVVKPIIVSR